MRVARLTLACSMSGFARVVTTSRSSPPLKGNGTAPLGDLEGVLPRAAVWESDRWSAGPLSKLTVANSGPYRMKVREPRSGFPFLTRGLRKPPPYRQLMRARQDRSDAEPGAIVLWGYCKQSQKAAAHRFL
jgi:hypothetical protein